MQAKITKETALKEIADAKEKIFGENILSVLESDQVREDVCNVNPPDLLLAAFMAGYVYWDADKNCLAQKLVKPVKSGEQSADILYYCNQLIFNMLIEEYSANDIAMVKNTIARLVGKSKQLIGNLEMQDLFIAKDISDFFYKS